MTTPQAGLVSDSRIGELVRAAISDIGNVWAGEGYKEGFAAEDVEQAIRQAVKEAQEACARICEAEAMAQGECGCSTETYCYAPAERCRDCAAAIRRAE